MKKIACCYFSFHFELQFHSQWVLDCKAPSTRLQKDPSTAWMWAHNFISTSHQLVAIRFPDRTYHPHCWLEEMGFPYLVWVFQDAIKGVLCLLFIKKRSEISQTSATWLFRPGFSVHVSPPSAQNACTADCCLPFDHPRHSVGSLFYKTIS